MREYIDFHSCVPMWQSHLDALERAQITWLSVEAQGRILLMDKNYYLLDLVQMTRTWLAESKAP